MLLKKKHNGYKFHEKNTTGKSKIKFTVKVAALQMNMPALHIYFTVRKLQSMQMHSVQAVYRLMVA